MNGLGELERGEFGWATHNGGGDGEEKRKKLLERWMNSSRLESLVTLSVEASPIEFQGYEEIRKYPSQIRSR